MAFMDWSDNLAVNVGELDSQHKKLISLINELHDAMRTGKGKDVIGKVLTDLIEYTKTHFAAEEHLMSANSFPGLYAHKKQHDDITKQVMDFNDQFQKGAVAVSVQIMKFLTDWLKSHILGTDKKYGPFLNNKGIV